ncbi:TIGR02453 family protein, partial [Flavobacterium sp. HMWF030]
MENSTIIPKSSLDFLTHLKENNNKPWFEANKPKYLIE